MVDPYPNMEQLLEDFQSISHWSISACVHFCIIRTIDSPLNIEIRMLRNPVNANHFNWFVLLYFYTHIYRRRFKNESYFVLLAEIKIDDNQQRMREIEIIAENDFFSDSSFNINCVEVKNVVP